MSFVTELKRRKVFQVAAVYLIVAWLVMQVVDVVSGPLLLPEMFARIVIVVLAIGFPITLMLSWVFDVTPEGVVRDEGGAASQGGGRTLEYTLIGLLVVAVAFLFFDNYASNDTNDSAETAATVPMEDDPAPEMPDRDVLPNSVAVLPLDNLSLDPNDALFAAGIHDQIINELTKIRDVSVIARTTVLQYENAAAPIPEIAAALRVETILEGSVRYAGNQVRVTAQLIDGDTGLHLWSEDYDGDRADIFGIQTEIATRIARELEAQLSPDELQRIERAPTDSPEAYDYYLLARALNSNIGGFFGDYEAFHGYLDRAIALDPNYAEAMAFKAAEYAFAASRPDVPGYESLSIPYREALAFGFAHKALSVDPNVGLGHMALGLIHRFNWRGADSVAAFERAYQLSPNNDDILDDYGRMLSFTGQHETAISIARRTAELRPNYIGLPDYLWRAGRYQEAADLFRRVNDPDAMSWANLSLALCELLLGDEAAARTAVRLTEQMVPGEDIFEGELAQRVYLYGRLGDSESAMIHFELLETTEVVFGLAPAMRALTYLGIGDEEQALAWLVIASESRGPENWSQAEVDIAINSFQDPVLDQTEFADVRSRLGYIDR